MASFIDYDSRYYWIYAIKSTAEVCSTFRKWLSMVERKTSREQKALNLDNDGEYLCTEMVAFETKRGIVQRLTVQRNLQQNRVAKSLQQTLLDLVCSMIYQKKPRGEYWDEAFKVAVHVRNQVTTRGIPELTTPQKIIFRR